MATTNSDKPALSGTLCEVFSAFLKLGLTSFGGPIAHLGYFREDLVTRRRWLTESDYADLVALCQFLPGPASSQVGFALGFLRAGLPGAILAWIAFTLPSALLLIGFAYSADAFGGPSGEAAIHGFKLVAVAVVAHAVWGMAHNLCPDRERASIAVIAVLIVVFMPDALGQIAAITTGAIAGFWFCHKVESSFSGAMHFPLSRRAGGALLGLFVLLLMGLPLLVAIFSSPTLHLIDIFYRAGALVFGGGHVVLPLLEARVVDTGLVNADAFLAGYGAAQAVPGPLFTFAAYLGALMWPESGSVFAAVIALLAIFLPGLLILLGTLPFLSQLRAFAPARSVMAGTNAAVVGILGAALYDPVWTSAVLAPKDFAIALTAFLMLTLWKVAPWIIVVLTVLGSVAARSL